ncbi:MAG: hypothetical protein K0R54_657 [Clostridiaceae bacterium]|nr:hypothetical protein [Clostridiaceae bacterium]
MFESEIIEFLNSNPFPSLSFLPVKFASFDNEQICFFYQDNVIELKKLEGTVKYEATFYEEKDNCILRFQFYITETLINHNINTIETRKEFPYIETEFKKNKLHKKALEILSEQNEFILYLYDKNTTYLNAKKFNFEIFQPVLKDFLKSLD